MRGMKQKVKRIMWEARRVSKGSNNISKLKS